MNGDSGKIYKAINHVQVSIARIETRQEERHNENINKFNDIQTHIKKCPQDDFRSVKTDITRLYWLVFVVIILGILVKMT